MERGVVANRSAAVRLLLDTHTLVWWTFSPHKLSSRARDAIVESDDVLVSAISAMEIATKVRLGKFEDARPLAIRFGEQVLAEGFDLLDVTADHGERAGNLVMRHKDPWDRLLVAQALAEDLIFVTNDSELTSFGAATLW